MTQIEKQNNQNALDQDWRAVGNFIFAALLEIAEEKGGQTLRNRVAQLAEPNDVLPNAQALRFLNEQFPGSAVEVLDRMAELQAEAHQAELTQNKNLSFWKLLQRRLSSVLSISEQK